MGFAVKGTIARLITITRSYRSLIAKTKPVPTDPRTPAQLAQRDKFIDCLAAWKNLTPEAKQDYITQARGYPQTALSLFMSACLMAPPSGATLHGHFPGVFAPGNNVIVRLFTPGSTTEVAKYATATDASGDFTIEGITPGTYDVGIKTDSSLSELVANQAFTAGMTKEVTFPTVRYGDLSNDDYVDSSDYGVLSGNWLQWGGCFGYPGNWLMP